jgi:hypothetical protein
MPTFEQRLFEQGPDAQSRFSSAARAVLGTSEGRIMLEMLCAAAHPLEHMAVTSAHEHGQCEVVAALWRYGSGDPRLLLPLVKT